MSLNITVTKYNTYNIIYTIIVYICTIVIVDDTISLIYEKRYHRDMI